MANFYFKKFAVRQLSSAMKVNTDGVLLPAWVSLPSQQLPCNSTPVQPNIIYFDGCDQFKILDKPFEFRVLDIGSGTGVISLIMAQRLDEELLKQSPNTIGQPTQSFSITAIDIDYDSFIETKYNFENSKWAGQLEARHISLQDFFQEQKAVLDQELDSRANSSLAKFDLILSNPPFFTNSLNAPSQARNNARHNHSLPLEFLLDSCSMLLKEGGVLAVILPVQEGERVLEIASKSNMLQIKKLCKVKTLFSKPPKRYMIELRKSINKELQIDGENSPMIEETLVIQEEGGEFYTNEYKEFVKRFYLKDLKIKKHSK